MAVELHPRSGYLQGGNSTVSTARCGLSLPCRAFFRPPKRPPEAAQTRLVLARRLVDKRLVRGGDDLLLRLNLGLSEAELTLATLAKGLYRQSVDGDSCTCMPVKVVD